MTGYHGQILADQLTLFKPEQADYAHHITSAPPPDLRTSYRLLVHLSSWLKVSAFFLANAYLHR